jgi:tyrosine-protein phosphatase SIW14
LQHRTGCVVGIVRKLADWPMDHVLAEYRGYAHPKPRDVDVQYLSSFDITLAPNYFHTAPFKTLIGAARRLSSRPRGFTRMTLFVAVVLMLWFITLVTGMKVDVHFPDAMFSLPDRRPLPPAEDLS